MKSLLLVLFGLVVGVAIGFVVFTGIGTGLGAGAGIVTGLKAGACLTAEAAKQQGFITADQESEFLQSAFAQLSTAEVEVTEETNIDCAKVVAELKEAAASQ